MARKMNRSRLKSNPDVVVSAGHCIKQTYKEILCLCCLCESKGAGKAGLGGLIKRLGHSISSSVFNREDEYPGTGIGLAVCSRIVYHDGARIGAEGRLGGGYVFQFTVPVG